MILLLATLVVAVIAACAVILVQVHHKHGAEGVRLFAVGAVFAAPPLITPIVLGIPAVFILATAAIVFASVFWAGRGNAARVLALDADNKSPETVEAQRRLVIAVVVVGTVWGILGGILFL